MTDFLTAAQAAQRLGVKPATLYAYVSRGMLSRQAAPTAGTSLFDADEVERLARRGRPRRPAGTADLTVESAITEIAGDRPALPRARRAPARGQPLLRGRRRAALDRRAPAERGSPDRPWRATPAALAAGRAVQAALPAGTLPLERFQVIVPAMAVTDPLRLHLDPRGRDRGRPGRSSPAWSTACLRARPPTARRRTTPDRRSRTGCGRGCPTGGPSSALRRPCRPRWSCSPTTNWPRPRWPRGSPRRSGPTRTRWSRPGSAR